MLLSVLFAILPAAPCLAEEPNQPAAQAAEAAAATAVAEAIQGAEDLNYDQLWERAERLRQLGSTAAVPVREAMATAAPRARLILARELVAGMDRELQEAGARVLLDLARSAVEPELRVYAANSLGQASGHIGAKWLLEALAAAVDAEGDPLVRVALHGARGRLGDDNAAAEALLAVMRTGTGPVRKEAALTLGGIGRAAHPDVRRELLLIYRNDPTSRADRAISIYRNSLARDPLFAEVMQAVTDYYDAEKEETLDRSKLVQSALRGMVGSLDPFSAYMDPEEGEQLRETLTGEYGGIGAYVNLVDGVFTIVSPIYGGPADKAGLRSMDRILEVDGIKTTGEIMTKTISRLKGKPGTEVKAKVFRRGWTEPREFAITRDLINVDSVMWETLPGGLGYIRVVRFAPEKTLAELRAALADFDKAGVRGLVLDLRDNPGGYLVSAVSLANEFLPGGKVIVSSRGRRVRQTDHRSDGTGRHAELPLVVLVNSGSASASEILAGALRDHKRARLVGEKTYGKGSVQEQMPLRTEPGASLKLTVAKYYLPGGDCVHETGITPDVPEPADEQVTPGWKYEEVGKVVDQLDEWAAGAYRANPDVFRKLAEDDGGDAARYPGLAEKVEELQSRAHVSAPDVRSYVRRTIRRLAADDRNRRFVSNIEDDRQLRRAALVLLDTLDGGKLAAPYDRYARGFEEEARQRQARAALKLGVPGAGDK
jgi:carboxyl-terminal processing protease